MNTREEPSPLEAEHVATAGLPGRQPLGETILIEQQHIVLPHEWVVPGVSSGPRVEALIVSVLPLGGYPAGGSARSGSLSTVGTGELWVVVEEPGLQALWVECVLTGSHCDPLTLPEPFLTDRALANLGLRTRGRGHGAAGNHGVHAYRMV